MAETEKLSIIGEADLEGKGVCGQADVPGLPAAEMQAKIEEIVREVAIAKINEIIGYINEKGVSKEELEALAIEAGAVTSVFGRAGDISAKAGDYTPEMVGAAEAKHAKQHCSGGSDPVAPEDIGAAEAEHRHGNIGSDGLMKSPYNASGLVLVTSTNGYIIGKKKTECGFLPEPTKSSAEGNIELELCENFEYALENVGSLSLVFGEINCFGTVTFGETVGEIAVEALSSEGDDILEAAPGETWEFSCYKGRVIWKNWGV